MLKKKGEAAAVKETKPEDDEAAAPARSERKDEEDSKAPPPWKKNKEEAAPAEDSEEEAAPKDIARDDEEAFTEVKAPAKKWVPPSLRKKQEDEEDSRRDDEVDRRKRDDDRDERPKKDIASGGSTAGKYVPLAKRKEMEQKAKEEEEQRAREEKEEEEKEARRAAEREAKAADKRAKKDAQDEKARAGKSAPVSKDKNQEPKKGSGPQVDEEKLRLFGAKCKEAIENAGAKVDALVKEVPKLLAEAELKTIRPVSAVLEPLLSFCRRKEDKQVISAVARFAPLLNCLIEKAEKWRFKVQLLCEAQKLVFDMGLPRLSPASALIEVFFDGLYQAEVIEEKYFELWTMSNDDTAGKTKAMFQLNDFLEWMRTAAVEGETDSEEEEETKAKGSDDEDEDEESDNDEDIEANVPKRAGLGRPIR